MSKVLISIPEEVLKIVDAYCKRRAYTRSEFIRECIRTRIDVGPVPETVKTVKEKKSQNNFSEYEAQVDFRKTLCKHGYVPSLCKFDKCRG